MLITKNNVLKYFCIKQNNKVIKHSSKIKILGNVLNDGLNWNDMIKNGHSSLLNQLRIRNYAISKVICYLDPQMKKNYVNAVFRGKLLFGIKTWGGTSQENIKLIQNQQNIAAKMALGFKFFNKTINQRQKELNWLSIDNEEDLPPFGGAGHLSLDLSLV